MKRKFAVSTVTSVRCEQKLIELADSMDIPLSDALMRGILLAAEFKLENEPGKYSATTHDLFLALQKKNLDEFAEWLGIQKLHQKRIGEYAEVKRQADIPAEIIEQTIISEVARQKFTELNLPEHDNWQYSTGRIRQRLVDEVSRKCNTPLAWKDIEQAVRKAVS